MQRTIRPFHSCTALKGDAAWRATSRGSRAPDRRRKSMTRFLLYLTGITVAGLLGALSLASSHTPSSAGAALSHLQADFKGHVSSIYGIADGYWHLEVNYSTPAVPWLQRSRYLVTNSNSSCWDLAKQQPEPYTREYHPTLNPPRSLPGDVPRAVWKWKGSISRKLFESVPFLLRGYGPNGGCLHCTFVLRYKVIDGQLYTDVRRRHRALDGQEEEVAMLEEMLLSALYMYKVPDVDFLLHLGDGSPAGLPLVQVNINRSNEQAGFTIPKFMWRDALGPQQFKALAQCLQVRYPATPQKPKIQRAVWRGSNTDSNVLHMDETNVLQVMRTRLHMYGTWFPGLFDAHYTGYPQQAFDTQCVETLLPPGPQMQLEDFNRYSLVLDIDGNGWSDRYRLISHFRTPVLKQASNLTAFFEHLAAPGIVVEHYAHDLSDLPGRTAALLQQLQKEPGWAVKMAERQQGLARYMLNHVSLMHAAAYTLSKVAELSQWKPQMEDEYDLVLFSKCCMHAPQLPEEFIQAVRAHKGLQQQGTIAMPTA